MDHTLQFDVFPRARGGAEAMAADFGAPTPPTTRTTRARMSNYYYSLAWLHRDYIVIEFGGS